MNTSNATSRKAPRASSQRVVTEKKETVLSKPVSQKKRAPRSAASRAERARPARPDRAISAPTSVGVFASGSYMSTSAGSKPGSIRVRGRDFLSQVTWSASAVAGSTLFNLPLNPTLLSGTRLRLLALTYEKYKFRNFSVLVRPNAPSTSSGGYGISYDHDPSDPTPASGDVGIRQFMAMRGTQDFSCWLPGKASFKPDEPLTDFFTNSETVSDERLVDQGQVYVWVLAQISADTSMVVEIEYDLELYIPSLEPSSTSVNYSGSSASAGDLSTFTNNSKLFNALGLAGASGQWPGITSSSTGNTTSFPITRDAAGNVRISLPPGIYTLVSSLDAAIRYGKDLSSIVNLFYPNEPTQSVASSPIFSTDTVAIPSSGGNTTVSVSKQGVVSIPQGGAVWYTELAPDANNDTAAPQLNKLSFSVIPGGLSMAPSLEFFNRPGKLGSLCRARNAHLVHSNERERERARAAISEAASHLAVRASSLELSRRV